MRENRLSGGVGGVAGEIPSLRPDPKTEVFEQERGDLERLKQWEHLVP